MNFFLNISPFWYIIPAFLLLFIFYLIIMRSIFKSKLKKVSQGKLSEDRLKEKDVIRYYKLVEKKLADPDSQLYMKRVIGQVWVKKLLSGGGKHWFNLIVKYFPQEFLFACFLQGLKRKSLFRVIKDFLEQDDIILNLEALGKSCASEPFDGRKAAQLLGDKKKELGLLTGSAMGDVRFFAYSILIYFEDSQSIQSVLGGFTDSHKPVRMLLVEHAIFRTREEGYEKLKNILLSDPSQTVRTMAGKRINHKYNDLKDFDITQLNREQIIHLISLMSENSDRDEKTAIALLETEDNTLIFEAASYLNRKGVLKRFLQELYPGDSYDFNRKIHLLKLAASVNVTDFFSDKTSWEREGSLLGAALILKGRGDLKWLEWLAQRVFSRDPYGTDYSLELYQSTLEAIDITGSDKCHQMKAMELKKHEDDPLILEILLSTIPVEREFFYMDDLFYLLENGQTFCQKLVRDRLAKYNPSLILTNLYDQLLDESNNRELRAHNLMIMVELHLDYTLHLILENLPLLEDEDLLSLPVSLSGFAKEKVKELCDQLFNSCDGEIHRSLILALPDELVKDYKDILLKFLKDRDSSLRKAALEKLHKLNFLSIQDGVGLLNDPHDEVRKSAAMALLEVDSSDILDMVGELLKSDDEVSLVKEAILRGLFHSRSSDALKLFFHQLTLSNEFKSFILDLLPTGNNKFYIENLARFYEESSPPLRKELAPSLIKIGSAMEDDLLSIIGDQSSKAREILVDLLKETGYISRLISQMKSPRVEDRIRVVEMLVYLNDRESLKAAVLAAGDPADRVRIAVIRALEKIDTAGGTNVLNELKNDPDKKVRHYAQWALERLKAKSI
jgi:HEAT repeat protein